jgi:hypothetical protein
VILIVNSYAAFGAEKNSIKDARVLSEKMLGNGFMHRPSVLRFGEFETRLYEFFSISSVNGMQ